MCLPDDLRDCPLVSSLIRPRACNFFLLMCARRNLIFTRVCQIPCVIVWWAAYVSVRVRGNGFTRVSAS